MILHFKAWLKFDENGYIGNAPVWLVQYCFLNLWRYGFLDQECVCRKEILGQDLGKPLPWSLEQQNALNSFHVLVAMSASILSTNT